MLFIFALVIAGVLLALVRLGTRRNPAMARPFSGVMALFGILLGLFAGPGLFAWVLFGSTNVLGSSFREGLIGLSLAVAGIWLVLSLP
jgi:hypothetical protein